MDQIRSLSQMIEEARKLCASKGKKRVSVAMAEDAGLISAIEEARRTGLVEATLVGNVEKVKACIAERGYHVDAEAFISFYESNGWKVGKNPMKSWRAALVTWEKRHTPSNTANPINQNAYGQGFTKTLAEQRRDRNNQDCADFFARKMAEINAYDMARRAAAAESL